MTEPVLSAGLAVVGDGRFPLPDSRWGPHVELLTPGGAAPAIRLLIVSDDPALLTRLAEPGRRWRVTLAPVEDDDAG